MIFDKTAVIRFFDSVFDVSNYQNFGCGSLERQKKNEKVRFCSKCERCYRNDKEPKI